MPTASATRCRSASGAGALSPSLRSSSSDRRSGPSPAAGPPSPAGRERVPRRCAPARSRLTSSWQQQSVHDELDGLRAELERTYPRYLDDLGRLVAIDSGSYQKAGVDAVAEWVMAQLADLGASVRRHPNEDVGDTLRGDVRARRRRPDGPARSVTPTRSSNPAPRPSGPSRSTAGGRWGPACAT